MNDKILKNTFFYKSAESEVTLKLFLTKSGFVLEQTKVYNDGDIAVDSIFILSNVAYEFFGKDTGIIMLTASEAAKLTMDIESNEIKRQLDKIEKDIFALAKEGLRTCYIDCPHPSVTKYLENLGYKVNKVSDQRNGSYITISW